jgi:hypothetical protein
MNIIAPGEYLIEKLSKQCLRSKALTIEKLNLAKGNN